jgi:16S rRNA (cytosine967-C5)-methyltransferase
LKRAFGEKLLDEMKAFTARAPVDLRVNTLKEQRAALIANLQSISFKAEAAPYSPTGIRVPPAEGLSALHRSTLFLEGAFEFQDEASQIGALLCAAKPGQRVLDLAAGAGGKSLALAAQMQNQGEVLAFDDSPQRLKPLRERAERAGATIIRIADKRGGPLWGDGKFDVVLVDAPCSGSGTWRRSPELKTRLTPEKLTGFTKLQDWLLADGARHTKAGGRLVYATCSILPVENEDRIEAFLKAMSGFAIVDAASAWRDVTRGPPPPGMGKYFHGSPHSTGTDGFFVCVMENRMDTKNGGH